MVTLIGVKPKNHPQQVGRRGADDKVDERITPQWLFDKYDEIHYFTLDAAATTENSKCSAYLTREDDGLAHPWAPHKSVWCNPPYSNLGAWVKKAHVEIAAGCSVIVMLLPANRTEQKWWQEWVEPYRDWPGSVLTTQFLARRLNFGLPGNEAAKFHSSPPFGLVVLTFSVPHALDW